VIVRLSVELAGYVLSIAPARRGADDAVQAPVVDDVPQALLERADDQWPTTEDGRRRAGFRP
jgi:hypothetical protein